MNCEAFWERNRPTLSYIHFNILPLIKNLGFFLENRTRTYNLPILQKTSIYFYLFFIFPDTENQTLTHSPESLADSFSSEPQNFVSFIYENYISHFREIEDVLEAVDSISRSDIFLTGFRDDFITQTGLNVAIRGVMVWNDKPVGGWRPVRGPKRPKVVNLKDELQGLGISTSISTNLLASEFRSYAKLIKKIK